MFNRNAKIGYLFANVEYLALTNKIEPIVHNESKVSKYLTINNNSTTFFGNTIEINKNGIALTSLYANFPLLFNIKSHNEQDQDHHKSNTK